MHIFPSLKNRNRLYSLGSFFIISLMIFSCSKNKDVTDRNNNNIFGQLTSFTVDIKERIPNRAIIEWTPSTNSFNSDTVKYKITLNGITVDSNLLSTIDTLNFLSKDTLYFGSVIAYIKSGDTISASFILEKYDGFIYLVSEIDQELRSYSSYTNGVNSQRLWNKPFNEQSGMPTISNDTLFLGTRFSPAGSLYAVNANTGDILWSGLTNTSLAGTSPTYFNGTLYATTGLGVFAINSANGQILWNYRNASNNIATNPVIDNNKVFVGNRSSAGHISALDISNGNFIWDFRFSGQMCTRPLVSKNLIIFGTSTAKIYALDQNSGNIVWTRDLSVTYNNYGCNWISPSLMSGNVIVHTANNGFYALNVLTGSTIWIHHNYDASVSSPAFGNGLIYFSTLISAGANTTAKIVAIDASNGHLQWESTGNQQYLFHLIYAKNRLYLREYNNILMVDPVTGMQQGHILNKKSSISLFGARINNISYYNCEHGNYTAR